MCRPGQSSGLPSNDPPPSSDLTSFWSFSYAVGLTASKALPFLWAEEALGFRRYLSHYAHLSKNHSGVQHRPSRVPTCPAPISPCPRSLVRPPLTPQVSTHSRSHTILHPMLLPQPTLHLRPSAGLPRKLHVGFAGASHSMGLALWLFVLTVNLAPGPSVPKLPPLPPSSQQMALLWDPFKAAPRSSPALCPKAVYALTRFLSPSALHPRAPTLTGHIVAAILKRLQEKNCFWTLCQSPSHSVRPNGDL